MGTKHKIQKYIKEWEWRCYGDGIPDVVPVEIDELVPSYKKICVAILKNDNTLKSLGFSKYPSELYNEIKMAELIKRGVIKKDNQLKLFS